MEKHGAFDTKRFHAEYAEIKRCLEDYEERKKSRTFDASNFEDDGDDDDYIATVRAALARGETLEFLDRSRYEHCLATKKCDSVLDMFDRLLDPFEMYFLDDQGIPSRVWAAMVWECPPSALQVIQDTCSAFARFSDWRWEKPPEPPTDWKENRQAIEDGCPLRPQLMAHLKDRLMDFCCDGGAEDIVQWYRHEAARRWKKVRSYVDKEAVIKYWIHIANKPGSAGHLSGIRFIEQT